MSTEPPPGEHHRAATAQPGFARTVVWLLRVQAALTIAAAGLALFAGVPTALAVLAGGGIGIVLTAAAALRNAVASATGDPAAMAAAFYRGMALKLGLAVVLFAVVAMWFAAWFLPVLTGYGVTLVAYWVALLRIGTNTGPGSAVNEK